jgi:hypothetical protein
MAARRIMGALLAQVLGQALTGWSLVAHVSGWPDVSVWVVAFLAAAALVPFRHDGSLKDRAAGNFGAAHALSGFLWWEVAMSGFGGILGGTGFDLGLEVMLMLAATVLFSVAGAVFWTLRETSGQE